MLNQTAVTSNASCELEAVRRVHAGETVEQVTAASSVHPNRLRELLRVNPPPQAAVFRPSPGGPGSTPGAASDADHARQPVTVTDRHIPRTDRNGVNWPPNAIAPLRLLAKYSLLGRSASEPNLSLDRIDRKASRRNQVRLVTLIDHEVERYQNAWKDGAVFPPALIRVLPNGKLFVLDGLHRIESAVLEGRLSIPAITVTLTDELASVLAVEANKEHGIPLDLSTRLAHGVQWVTARNYTVDRAAESLGLTPSRLYNEIKTVRAEERALRLRPRGWDQIKTVASRQRLAGLANNATFLGAVALAADAGLSHSDINQVVTDLNGVGDLDAQTEVLRVAREALRERIERRSATGTGRKHAALPREKLMDGIDQLARTFEEQDLGALFDGVERPGITLRLEALRAQVDAAITRLKTVR